MHRLGLSLQWGTARMKYLQIQIFHRRVAYESVYSLMLLLFNGVCGTLSLFPRVEEFHQTGLQNACKTSLCLYTFFCQNNWGSPESYSWETGCVMSFGKGDKVTHGDICTIRTENDPQYKMKLSLSYVDIL